MELIGFVKEYWVILSFLVGLLFLIIKVIFYVIEAVKCSLRNDILDIYDKCKDSKEITHYQLEALEYSATIYFKLKGNSFVKDIVSKVRAFKVID